MPKTKRKLKSFMLDLGNSTDGQIGAVVRITAYTKKEALAALRAELPDSIEAKRYCANRTGKLEYMNVYFNVAKVTLKDISEVEDVEDEP